MRLKPPPPPRSLSYQSPPECGDFAVAILCYDRPGLLDRCIRSVRANGLLDQAVFCVDGAADKAVADLVAKLKRPTITQKTRLGADRHAIEGASVVFGRGFQKVLVLDSDVELAPSAIRVMMAAQAWLENFTAQRFVIVSEVCCRWPLEQKRRFLPVLQLKQASGTNYLASAIAWHAAERTLRRLSTATPAEIARLARHVPMNWPEAMRREFITGRAGTCVDAWRLLAFSLTGTRVASLAVNRATHDVATGRNSNPLSIDLARRSSLDVFEEDANLTEFTLEENVMPL